MRRALLVWRVKEAPPDFLHSGGPCGKERFSSSLTSSPPLLFSSLLARPSISRSRDTSLPMKQRKTDRAVVISTAVCARDMARLINYYYVRMILPFSPQ